MNNPTESNLDYCARIVRSWIRAGLFYLITVSILAFLYRYNTHTGFDENAVLFCLTVVKSYIFSNLVFITIIIFVKLRLVTQIQILLAHTVFNKFASLLNLFLIFVLLLFK